MYLCEVVFSTGKPRLESPNFLHLPPHHQPSQEKVDEEETVRSPPCQSTSLISSPRTPVSSVCSSKFKSLKSVADQCCAIKRGKVYDDIEIATTKIFGRVPGRNGNLMS